MYTFVRYPRMYLTESERMVRKVMIHRKNRQTDNMRTFEICMITWGKLNLDLSGKLLEMLTA